MYRLLKQLRFHSLCGISVLCLHGVTGCGGSENTAIHHALAQARWTESRLSVDTPAQICATRTAQSLQDFCTNYRATNELSFGAALTATNTALDPHSRALVLLARGAPAAARTILEQQIATGGSPAVWNDLSAAILAQSKSTYDWRAIESALIAAETALKLDRHFRPALFNRALILEKLALDESAIDAYDNYHAAGATGDWLAEALARKNGLKKTGASSLPVPSFSVLTSLDLTHIEHAVSTQASNVQRFLDSDTSLYRAIATDAGTFCEENALQWRALGEAFANEYHDALLRDGIEWACAQPDAVEALLPLAQAIERYERFEMNAALEAAHDAEQRLRSARSPLADVAIVFKAMALYASDRYDESLAVLEPHASEIAVAYPMLAARAQRYLGSIAGRQQRFSEADRHFRLGLELLSRGGDPQLRARLHSLAAENLAFAGRYDDAWREGLDALRLARELALPVDALSAACEFLSIIAANAKAAHLQNLYAECSIRHLEDDTSPTYITSAHTIRAQARMNMGDAAGAARDLGAARKAIESIADPSEREHLLRFFNLFAAMRRNDRSNTALESVEQSLAYFSQRGLRNYEVAANTALAHAYANHGAPEQASYYLDNVAELAVRAQSVADTAAFSLPIQQHYRHVTNQRIVERLEAGDGANALRVLIESRLARPFTDDEVRDLIADVSTSSENDATLVLAWLDNDVAGWLIDGGGLQTWYRSPLPQAQTVVARAADTHSTPLPEGRRGALTSLYQALITPVATYIEDTNMLRIVPDDVLFGVPYPALRNPRTDQLLAEEQLLSVSPELLVRNARAGGEPIKSVAVFANPSADPRRRLESVTDEAGAIRRWLDTTSSVDLFVSEDATPKNFLSALSAYDVVHFGGHGEVDSKSPLNSRLVIGPGNGSEGTLTAAQLYAHTPSSMPALIVLAACDSAAYTDRLPQALATVRPLLDLGARQVIGSLRPIPDREYRVIMEHFYEALARTGEPALALRSAHLAMAETDAELPGSWAYLQLYRYL